MDRIYHPHHLPAALGADEQTGQRVPDDLFLVSGSILAPGELIVCKFKCFLWNERRMNAFEYALFLWAGRTAHRNDLAVNHFLLRLTTAPAHHADVRRILDDSANGDSCPLRTGRRWDVHIVEPCGD